MRSLRPILKLPSVTLAMAVNIRGMGQTPPSWATRESNFDYATAVFFFFEGHATVIMN